MNFSTRTYILITFALLTLVRFGTSKICSWSFYPNPKDKKTSFCVDPAGTHLFPSGNCRPSDPKGSTTTAQKCMFIDPNFPDLREGVCPTYRAMLDYTDLDKPTRKLKGYSCDLLVTGKDPNGRPYAKNTYAKYVCEILTNPKTCTGKGKFITKDPPPR
ncbi:hypothetical protein DFH28DRAFT_1219880 [Melampsora americana]|nr:hypothetical protein DFH28DRAFT_1219880 [Melampsora americana]